ncbi:MAG: peptidylprolyl isomerase [Gammaproteobacteria bacterium]|nr:MAG: peptidylprolyl isomerase [Gammaproteobacteria bacterium]
MGSRVRMHLRLELHDGTVVEDTFATGQPLEFTLGDGTLVRGLELGLLGLRPGDEQTLTLAPEQAYGTRDPALVVEVPRAAFPEGVEPKPGLVMTFDLGEVKDVPGLLLAVGEESVTVDLNHPLAGKPIIYHVQVLSVSVPEDETA